MSKKARYRNKEDGLRVIYDEDGTKRELVPQGTILLDASWAGRFRCLEKVEQTPKKQAKDTSDKTTDE